jgi:hypothetical protein
MMMPVAIHFENVNCYGKLDGHFVAHRSLDIISMTLSMPANGHLLLYELVRERRLAEPSVIMFDCDRLLPGHPFVFDKPLYLAAGRRMTVSIISSFTGPIGTRWQRLKSMFTGKRITVPATLILKTIASDA